MKGYIGIDIPTKRYIAAYIRAQLGAKPIMNRNHFVGQKFRDLLDRDQVSTVVLQLIKLAQPLIDQGALDDLKEKLARVTNEDRSQYGNKYYDTHIRLYIDMHTFSHRGHYINETFIKDFNRFVELFLKERITFLVDLLVQTNTLENSIDIARGYLQIEDEDWQFENIKRYYHRYRKRKKLPLLYLKKTVKARSFSLPEVSPMVFELKQAI